MPNFQMMLTFSELERRANMKFWKFLGMAFVCLAMVLFIGCGEAEKESAPETETEPEVVEMMAVDYTPTADDVGTEISCGVCGMKMAVTEDMPAVTYDGVTYYFCSPEEKAKFVAAPMDFIGKMEEEMEGMKDKAEKAVEEATGH
jgi:YHS domain-containing protein